ncbi:tyrosine-protein kinase receptor UFO isoform X2 [Rhinatrema bivittatum]|uniref:tyrosine-protein kinase receptor UFO isoform X2 n=1 Tax=Rhinatrema bivittatum TaxID=194408 RepID=UPI001129950A|nr:tyrosine-protein kinase receptor UFO isoform X2 [Rhinatrema bivittatum]
MGRIAGMFLLLTALDVHLLAAQNDIFFIEDPANMTSSLGKDVRLRCAVRVNGELPEINWLHDREPLEVADVNQVLMPLSDDDWLAISELSIASVQLSDSGAYQCAIFVEGEEIVSEEAHLELEGLPIFLEEPQDLHVLADLPFNLSCSALGPPEPVQLIWLQDGMPLNSLMDPLAQTPSALTVNGLNKTSTFSCEAHNAKGVTTSRTATVKVFPRRPRNLQLVSRSSTALEISWEPGFSGDYPIFVCTVQAARPHADPGTMAPHDIIHNQNLSVPPYSHVINDLTPFTSYDVRLACRSSEGTSRWTDWVTIMTLEGVPPAPPENITAFWNGSLAIIQWMQPRGALNGILRGYKLAYQNEDSAEVVIDVGLKNEMTLEMMHPVRNLTVRVAPYTEAGDGPWSNAIGVSLRNYDENRPHSQQVGENPAPVFSWHWWYIVMAVAVAACFAILVAIFLARLRKKETRYGEAFEPALEQGELVVRYRVKKSYSRRTTEATLNSLGISDDLKEKLRDVMVDRHKVALGKTLGEGEFGSVMEGQLNQDDYILKVAVKTMKIAICTRSEMEDFLSEAVCMKEFDHPNVMRLIGVCLQNTENEGYPSPVVILPFMKHGDLHSFLLFSRLGDNPVYLPTRTLVKFMTDIASGMEYLSAKNFIHRDLAARNCMLNENMNVCVADFGLSKKIYNGDYYRQGRISKMPVKWIAMESLADRVYTSKSDVWSFGVTMWEIATRGQTPYPGVENSEIYDYLRQGNRLKQPPDCLDGLYKLMYSCWLVNAKDRPSFETLHGELEKILKGLPPVKEPEEILYVNMEDTCASSSDVEGDVGAVGGLELEDLVKESCLKGSPITAEVHQPLVANRYVLCPAHDNRHVLCESWASDSAAPCATLEEAILEEIHFQGLKQ